MRVKQIGDIARATGTDASFLTAHFDPYLDDLWPVALAWLSAHPAVPVMALVGGKP